MARILIACECSGIVRRAFAARGHDVISVDLQPADDGATWMMDPLAGIGRHFTGDIREFLELWRKTRHTMALEGQGIPGFDLAIAHPVCKRLTNSGVRWLAERDLWDDMREGAAFFNFMKELPAPRIAIENPVMHRYANAICGKWTQTIQPWQFGDPAFKRTGLWLTNLPKLEYTNVLTPPKKGTEEHKRWSKVHRCSPGPGREKERSIFFPGIADAMAAQWGALL